jgi:hypothetical protein
MCDGKGATTTERYQQIDAHSSPKNVSLSESSTRSTSNAGLAYTKNTMKMTENGMFKRFCFKKFGNGLH